MIEIPAFVQKLQSYVPGKPLNQLSGRIPREQYIRLASNENPRGPSLLVQKAIQESTGELNRYTDPVSTDLVNTISEIYKVEKNHIVCGHGTDSILASIISAFTEEKDEILTSEGTFIGLYVNVRKIGRRVIQVPLKNYTFDLEAILGRVTEYTKMVYIANPNNPTGTMITRGDLESFMDRLPNNILVVLDEAYTPYAEHLGDYPDGLRYDYENMVVTRTLSKAHGLAGLRIGFAVGPDKVIEALYKIKLPFDPGLLPQRAGVAALRDTEFLKTTVELNHQSLEIFTQCFREIGLKYIESVANFVTVILKDADEAQDFYTKCLDQGLVLRPLTPFGIPKGIRISSGTVSETEKAIQIIKDVYQTL